MFGNILNIAFLVCLVALVILFGKNKILTKVAEYINLAEDYSKVGTEKFNWCVEQLRNLLPNPLRAIFTDKIVGEIVENIYVSMRDLANKRIKQNEEAKEYQE